MKIQNLLITTFLFSLVLFFIPVQVEAICEGPIVPCGTDWDKTVDPPICLNPCTFCHLFELVNNIIEYILTCLVPITAVLMLVIGGFYLLTAGASPERVSKAKSAITAVVIGLTVIFIAWVFLNTFLMYIGVAEWTGLLGTTGTAEAGGLRFLRDNDQNWTDNEFVGFPALITGGPGEGDEATIISNTNSTINVNIDWGAGAGSEYKIGGWFYIKCP